MPEFEDSKADPSIVNDFLKSQEEPEESFGKPEQFDPDLLEEARQAAL